MGMRRIYICNNVVIVSTQVDNRIMWGNNVTISKACYFSKPITNFLLFSKQIKFKTCTSIH